MTDYDAISLAKSEFREAYNTGNVERLLAVFADDGFADMSEGEPSFFGEEAWRVLRHRMKKLFSDYDAHLAVIIIDIDVCGNLGYDFGWHKLTLRSKDGAQTLESRYRYFEKWKKHPDGKWKIVLYLTNRDLPPAMPPCDME